MKADLHIHSYLSDGKCSPSHIVEYAVQNTLSIIALTDHDTVAGLEEARQAAQHYPALTFIAGVELSTSQDEEELHILGYGIKDDTPAMLELLARAQENRKRRINRTLTRLQHCGIRLTIHDIQRGNHTKSLGRMHIARLLIQRGYVRSIREAFDRYLSYDTNIIDYSPTEFVCSEEAITVILDAGGIPVLAHPTIALFDRYIDVLIGYGLQGIEVFKGTRTSIEEYYLDTVAKDKGLLSTGGSDWHGFHPTLRLGNFSVDAARIRPFLEKLQLA